MTPRARLDDSAKQVVSLDELAGRAVRAAADAERAAAAAASAAKLAAEQVLQTRELVERQLLDLGRGQTELREAVQKLRERSDIHGLTVKIAGALSALAAAIVGATTALAPSPKDQRQEVTVVATRAVQDVEERTRQLVEQEVLRRLDDARARDDQTALAVRRALATLDRDRSPKRDPSEGERRAADVMRALLPPEPAAQR